MDIPIYKSQSNVALHNKIVTVAGILSIRPTALSTERAPPRQPPLSQHSIDSVSRKAATFDSRASNYSLFRLFNFVNIVAHISAHVNPFCKKTQNLFSLHARYILYCRKSEKTVCAKSKKQFIRLYRLISLRFYVNMLNGYLFLLPQKTYGEK